MSDGNLRILLWDIDGTLLRSAKPGSFKEYTVPIFERVFGTAGKLKELSVSGMTDLQIVAESLRDEKFTRAQIGERLKDLQTEYLKAMELQTAGGGGLFQTVPGAREALEQLSLCSRYRSAILTGNIEPAANFKLRVTGLLPFFTLPGAFGHESFDRRDLPALAAERISRHLKMNLEPFQFIVIGDTPNDIACAKHFGARAVAIASGRSFSGEELLALGPDALLPSLCDTPNLLRTLNSL